MALLYVGDIVLDPDFADEILCKRGTQAIGLNGRANNVREETYFYGVVTQADGSNLARLDSGETIHGAITVHSQFALIDGALDTTADIIEFKSREYTVMRVDSYSHFGQGFTAATCALLPVSG